MIGEQRMPYYESMRSRVITGAWNGGVAMKVEYRSIGFHGGSDRDVGQFGARRKIQRLCDHLGDLRRLE